MSQLQIQSSRKFTNLQNSLENVYQPFTIEKQIIIQFMNSSKISQKTTQSHSTQVQKTAKLVKETIADAICQIKGQPDFQEDQLPHPHHAMTFLKRISLDLDQEKTFRYLQKLKQGYIVKKHSANTSEPHDKFIYVSEDHRFFCWKSVDKNDQKSIELRKIKDIFKGRKMAKSKTIHKLPEKNEQNCIVIDSQARMLQIQANNEQIIDILYVGIQEAVKNSKRMHLSYRF